MKAFVLAATEREDAIARVADFLGACIPGKRVSVVVTEYRRKRSDEQNKYLWGVCYEILMQATGQEREDWHEYMLGEWGGWEKHELFGRKQLRPVRRSSKLTTTEFSDYWAFIQRRAAENGIIIPDPEPRHEPA